MRRLSALVAGALCTLAVPLALAAADLGALARLGQGGQPQFLPPEQAFRADVRAVAADRIEIHYRVTPGYYLYRDKLKFQTPATDRATLGKAGLPAGETKTDDYFGTQVVYHEDFLVSLPVSRSGTAAMTLPLRLGWQGCADAGLCYPPSWSNFTVELPAGAGTAAVASPGGPPGSDGGGYVAEQDRLAGLIRDGNLALMIGAFFLAGLVLAFTPCVLPMVPIISGIIAGEGAGLSRQRGFLLSLAYVLGMAVTYTAAGMAFAAAGQQAQTVFQQPWIIMLFALLFVAMALSMFGLFTVQMPSFLQSRLADLSNRQKAGSFAGVAVMGALSALIVTTCVGPALVAALSVIGQSGEVLRGGLALFAMALGMGTPLLVVGASAGQWLPRAGAWMDTVKQVFGALMLGVAAWMLSRLVEGRWGLLLWVLPLASLAVVLWRAVVRMPLARHGLRLAAAGTAAYALLLVSGSLRGAVDPLAPWSVAPAHAPLPFVRIKSTADLDRELAAAGAAGKAVLLDFYADWCVSCKEMERYTFTAAPVRAALAEVVWLQADVTANDDTDQALLQRFGIFGPPTIALFDRAGEERREFRVVGFMPATDFAPLVTRALGTSSREPS
ncbi:MAG: hypothetical protein RL026_2362 [Pseudomonadota bacterium]|jgi:thiol:disulfide interchange protein DsbD